jgi:hypothetical protein
VVSNVFWIFNNQNELCNTIWCYEEREELIKEASRGFKRLLDF